MSDVEFKKAYEKFLKENIQLHAKIQDLEKRLDFTTKEASKRLMTLTNMHNNAVEKVIQYLIKEEIVHLNGKHFKKICELANYLKIQ